MSDARTQWFPYFMKPVHVGIYEVTRKIGKPLPKLDYLYWNGKLWFYCEDSLFIKSGWASMCDFSRDLWRGLAEKPL